MIYSKRRNEADMRLFTSFLRARLQAIEDATRFSSYGPNRYTVLALPHLKAFFTTLSASLALILNNACQLQDFGT